MTFEPLQIRLSVSGQNSVHMKQLALQETGCNRFGICHPIRTRDDRRNLLFI